MTAGNRFSPERNAPEPHTGPPLGILAVALAAQLVLVAANNAEVIIDTADRVIEFSIDNIRAAWRGFMQLELE